MYFFAYSIIKFIDNKKDSSHLLMTCSQLYQFYYLLYQHYFIKDKYVNDYNKVHVRKLFINKKIELPKSITHLTFGWRFNEKIEFPKSITHLTFGWRFNKKIELPKSITHLTFGENFNKKVELPESITYLTFGENFNKKVELPESITHLSFGFCFDHKIELPESIMVLKIYKHQRKLFKILASVNVEYI